MVQLSWTPPEGGRKGITLETHIVEGMLGRPGASGAFTSLLNLIALASKLVSSRVRAAGLADVLGWTGKTNVQGEEVQKLDEYANEVFCTVLSRRSHCAWIASEELDDPIVGSDDPSAKYVVMMLVYATREGGVHGFTFDPGVGEFFLSHENIRCPPRGKTYSINEGNSALWTDPVRKWNAWLKDENKAEGRPYGHRYVGSLVADAHRTLLKGGIFAYPPDRKSPKGKLRLLYEANPFAFLFEAAGGSATDGAGRILDIEPTELHQRTPLILGSRDDVRVFGEFMRGER